MTDGYQLFLLSGFATYVSYLGTDHVFPEYRFRDRFLLVGQQYVFMPDSLESTREITIDVSNPDYDTNFGAIAYQKGGSLLRMIEHFLTEEVFEKGLSNYLKKFSYSNAETKDLWESLADVSGLPITRIMSGWTDQPGYPVVTYNGTHVKQQRFYLNPKGNYSR